MDNKKYIPVIALAGLSVFFYNAASAETLKKAVIAPQAIVPKPSNAERVFVRRDGQGSFVAAANKKFDKTSALSSFKLEFQNGDHKIHTIRLMPMGGDAHISLADKDGNDPFSVDATWWNVPGATMGVVDFQYGEKQKTMPNLHANTSLAIAGFETYLATGNDCHIEQIAIGFSPDQKKINVDFGKGCNKTPKIRVLYSEIPNNVIKDKGSITGADRNVANISGSQPKSDKYLIQGFNIKFTNGGHFLQSVGIHLKGAAREVISWQDNNRDDPIDFRVDWLELN